MNKTTGNLVSPLDMLSEMAAEDGLQLREIPLARIHPDPDQPRKEFGGEEDELFAQGLKETGLAQPLLVRPHPDPELADDYMIVVGERRYRGALRAGLETAPCQIKANLTPGQLAVLQLAENESRKSLSDLETAHGMRRALDLNPDLTQATLARQLGRTPAYINQHLALLDPKRVSPTTRAAIESGRLRGASNALAFEALPPEKKTELLTGDAPITRRALDSAASRAPQAPRPRLVREQETASSSTPDRRPSGSSLPVAPAPLAKKSAGRPRSERRIAAALVWPAWLRLFERLEAAPPASPEALESALRDALRD